MQFNLRSKAAVTAVGAGAVAVAISGVAFAYYSGGVSGTKTATAGVTNSTVSDVTIDSAGAISGLTPGGTVDATVTIKNNNAFSVHYPAGTITAAYSSATPTACTTDEALISGSVPVAAGVLSAGETKDITVPVKMGDSTTVPQDDCKGASITVSYTLAAAPVQN